MEIAGQAGDEAAAVSCKEIVVWLQSTESVCHAVVVCAMQITAAGNWIIVDSMKNIKYVMKRGSINRRWLISGMLCIVFNSLHAQSINREAVVRRHTIHINKADSLSSLTVGNGRFAFTVDVTGLQSFPGFYAKGVPLGTQSEWGWHSFPNTEHYKPEEAWKVYELEGKKIPYAVQWKEPERNRKAADYFRVNPHRLQLGQIGLKITKKNGQSATINDIKNIDQQLDLWTGEIKSRFTVENEPVEVTTYAHQQQDGIAVKIVSSLLAKNRLKLWLRYPYPNGQFKDVGTYIEADSNKHGSQPWQHHTTNCIIRRKLDSTFYATHIRYNKNSSLYSRLDRMTHEFWLTPTSKTNILEATIIFTQDLQEKSADELPDYETVKNNSINQWAKFWKSGGAIDFAGSSDKRATELERRVVLSQYLTKVQCASDYPPQETGLTYNSWFGKPHLEMHWWHAVHFALWGRPELMEKSLDWYFTVANGAHAIAQRQGFEGVRWQKMTDHAGQEAPSSVGAFLIWQQPHFIYMAELLYRARKNKQVLEKYKDLLFATADFMASFPTYDSATKKYKLGKGLIPAQECFDAVTTFNPTYELVYWYWALSVAQQWRERLGLPRVQKWDSVMNNLSPLPQANGVYLATESTPDCYTNPRYITDHPAVLGAYSTLPACHGMDTAVMKRTYSLIEKVWKWETTWGWDFPLMAMTATRLQWPGKAIDALFMPVRTNTYLVNGHNYQDERLTIYLPGNGGLLSAVAMMCAGWDGSTEANPGFPKDGWKVRWEGLARMF